VTHQDRAAVRIKVALGQRERLAYPKPGAPHDDDQPTQPLAVRAIARDAHDEHDLLAVGGSAG